MKKLISSILVLVMSLSLFTGCRRMANDMENAVTDAATDISDDVSRSRRQDFVPRR